MADTARIVHYVNQFFAGLGGEHEADAPVGRRSGPVGPGVLLQQLLGSGGSVVATVWCGDNRFHEGGDALVAEVLGLIGEERPAAVIVGPAFNAGRYGTACAVLGSAIVKKLGVPVVSGMFPENPGVDVGRREIYIVETTALASGMRPALETMARLALRLARGESLGPADVEGYVARGNRKNVLDARIGAERMADMLVARLSGAPFRTELELPSFDRVSPAPPVKDLAHARVALVTEAGIVPQGNPDALEAWRATKWIKYRIADLDALTAERFTSVHGGFDTTEIRRDPHRIVPLDIARELEREGRIGRIHEDMYVTMGNVAPVARAQRFGREIAQDLRKECVDAVLLTAT
jgi:glycine reductase complex component B subunit gamma